MHPDFVFFHEVKGEVRASIIDPHGHHLDDADVKLKALASFAVQHGQAFHRVEALSMVGGKMKVLDLKIDDVQKAVAKSGRPAADLYLSEFAIYFGD